MYNDWLLKQKGLLREFSSEDWASQCATKAIEEASSRELEDHNQFKEVAINLFKWQIDSFQKQKFKLKTKKGKTKLEWVTDLPFPSAKGMLKTNFEEESEIFSELIVYL